MRPQTDVINHDVHDQSSGNGVVSVTYVYSF